MKMGCQISNEGPRENRFPSDILDLLPEKKKVPNPAFGS
jgi:hypothetical protein